MVERQYIVGLAGYATSGKDTVASMLVKNRGFVKIAFADLLRQAVRALNPIVAYQSLFPTEIRVRDALVAYGYDESKVKFPEYRRLLQAMGTEVGREIFGEDFWVDYTMRKVHSLEANFVVIPDVRFFNEAQAIRNTGGEVIRIDRLRTTAVNEHISEHALDTYTFDFTIDNDGTLADLEEKVLKIF